jgi:excisionase family DNA binding protein
MAEPLWRVQEFAEFANISLDSAYWLIDRGRVPGVVRLGPRSIRIDPERVREWVAAGGNRVDEAMAR